MIDYEKLARIIAGTELCETKSPSAERRPNAPDMPPIERVDTSKLPPLGLATSQVDFHGDLITVVRHEDGKGYVALRPFIECLGLAWAPQYRKIVNHPALSQGVINLITPSSGGDQETLLIEYQMLHGWLFTVDTNRVKLAIRDKILDYQRECFQVLHDYFVRGYAINSKVINTSMPRTEFDSLVRISKQTFSMLEAVLSAISRAADLVDIQHRFDFMIEVASLSKTIHNAVGKPEREDCMRLLGRMFYTGVILEADEIDALTRGMSVPVTLRHVREYGIPVIQLPKAHRNNPSRYQLAPNYLPKTVN